mmetsp:Transcript_427/g.511  ORF Transcript_427/g.511 Transcript_427/m.511 type:complete len:192 (-) Transcript_427:640-1215(-)
MHYLSFCRQAAYGSKLRKLVSTRWYPQVQQPPVLNSSLKRQYHQTQRVLCSRENETSETKAAAVSGSGEQKCSNEESNHKGPTLNDLSEAERESVTRLLKKVKSGEKMIIGFTCSYAGPCETPDDERRQHKIISKKSYYEGVCLVKCPCEKLHLIADNLGWFGDDRNIEEILSQRGESVQRLSVEGKFDIG